MQLINDLPALGRVTFHKPRQGAGFSRECIHFAVGFAQLCPRIRLAGLRGSPRRLSSDKRLLRVLRALGRCALSLLCRDFSQHGSAPEL